VRAEGRGRRCRSRRFERPLAGLDCRWRVKVGRRVVGSIE
jgi:hypothetical protein